MYLMDVYIMNVNSIYVHYLKHHINGCDRYASRTI